MEKWIRRPGYYKWALKEWFMTNVYWTSVKVTDDYGMTYFLDADSRRRYFHLGNTLFDDRSVLALLDRIVNEHSLIIDIGANIGLFSIYASKLAHGGAVHAIEAELDTYERLRRNLELSPNQNVIASRYAIADVDGELNLNVFAKVGIWNSLGVPSLIGPTGEVVRPDSVQVVPALTLDTFVEQKRISKIDVLKIDVEGAECDVLAGAQEVLADMQVGYIIFEVSQVPLEGTGHTALELFDLIESYGFQIFRILEDGNLEAYHKDEDAGTRMANFCATRL